jgi:hypothetical protein
MQDQMSCERGESYLRVNIRRSRRMDRTCSRDWHPLKRRERSDAMEDLNKPEAGRTLEIPRQGIMKAKDPLGFDLRQAAVNGRARAVEKPDTRI